MSRTYAIAAALCAALITLPAAAYEIGSQKDNDEEITGVQQGMKELVAESILVVSHRKTGDKSLLQASTLSGVAFRIFFNSNIGLDINGGVLYKNFGEQASSIGGYAGAMVHYSARLGRDLFLRPGVGVGGFYGSNRSPTETPGLMNSAQVFGGLGRARLMLSYYASERFSLQAGPEAVAFFGRTKPETGESQSYFTIDAGFLVGMSYVF